MYQTFFLGSPTSSQIMIQGDSYLVVNYLILVPLSLITQINLFLYIYTFPWGFYFSFILNVLLHVWLAAACLTDPKHLPLFLPCTPLCSPLESSSYIFSLPISPAYSSTAQLFTILFLLVRSGALGRQTNTSLHH